MPLCEKLAKNGKPCERPVSHRGLHGNRFCTRCAERLKHHRDRCQECGREPRRSPERYKKNRAYWKNHSDTGRMSVRWHHHAIFSGLPRHRTYRGMPFYDGWDPKRGGSYDTASKWIVDNLGTRPGPEWSLDIIKHEVGFVPNNLRWAKTFTQNRNQQRHRLSQFSLEDLQVELRRHGYDIVKRPTDLSQQVLDQSA